MPTGYQPHNVPLIEEYIFFHLEQLLRNAQKGYREFGRGALIVEVNSPDPYSPAYYAPEKDLAKFPHTASLDTYIHDYNPETEMTLWMLVHTPKGISGHAVRWIPPETPHDDNLQRAGRPQDAPPKAG